MTYHISMICVRMRDSHTLLGIKGACYTCALIICQMNVAKWYDVMRAQMSKAIGSGNGKHGSDTRASCMIAPDLIFTYDWGVELLRVSNNRKSI